MLTDPETFVCRHSLHPPLASPSLPADDAETKNTWHRPDPSFAYLLSFFLVLTSLAWGLAYTPSVGAVARLALLFVGVHFLGSSLVVAGVAYCCVGRVFGPGGLGARLLGRPRRRGGLFTPLDDGDAVEFGYCFDVSEPPGSGCWR